MIDWDATQTECGVATVEGYRPKVICRCDECGKKQLITIRVKSKVKDNQFGWVCPKCVGLHKDVREKLSKATKQQWDKEAYCAVRAKSSSELWRDDEYVARHGRAVQSIDSRKKCSEAAIKAWSDPGYREVHAIALARQLNNRPGTELKFDNILREMGVSFTTNYVVGPYTFDYKIDRNNKPTLLIEINGNYWHTRPYVVRKDKAKVSYMADIKGFELKTMWEHQLFDVGRTKKLVSMWLGFELDRKHVDLKDINYMLSDLQLMREFMSNYHYLGGMGRSGILVGGYCDDNLICGAVLAHPTRKEVYTSLGLNKKEALELTRFAISDFVCNKNMASHFLARLPKFVSDNIKVLISFSDPASGHVGTIYKAANWRQDGETTPSYFYMNRDGWKLHKKTLYNQARAAHLNEAEFSAKFGYTKIHTPPKMKFVYEVTR